ncbi:MAG: YbgA family protein [Bacillota bacterium]|nr:YbgA family protein [Bacillota bacterium]
MNAKSDGAARRQETLSAPSGDFRRIVLLEREWSRYKYAVLEHSPKIYLSIRALLRDKNGFPAVEFYRLVDLAEATPPSAQMRSNAAAHVWGYFRKCASEAEKTEYRNLMSAYLDGEASIAALKAFLWRMTIAYDVAYLKESYYF